MVFRAARRFVILVAGFSLILFGIALIFLPGPAILVIPAGFLVLATEFSWAQHVLSKIKQQISALRSEA